MKLRFKRRKKLTLILFFLTLISLMCLQSFYMALNSHTLVPPLEFQSNVKDLVFFYTKDIPDEDICTSRCYYWNPSIIEHNNQVYVAARESTRSQCNGFMGTVGTLYNLLRPALSSVVIGQLDGNKIEITQRLSNQRLGRDGPYHFGHEDPRWIRDKNRLFLLTVREKSGVPRHFITQVFDQGFGPSVEIQSFNKPQKNWMHVPQGEQDLLFVYSLSPLQMVRVNPDTGDTVFSTESLQETVEPTQDTFRISGSSPFIEIEPNTLLGLAHSKRPHPLATQELTINLYTTYFVLLKKEKEWKQQRQDPICHTDYSQT
ncbi:hypothetical protein EDD86DRAFT_250174 [Gorgonomyces haynaldii]|nr:hypothetical protein EDD86DRAFT_250174 [Gorgonomyces haynaldii]